MSRASINFLRRILRSIQINSSDPLTKSTFRWLVLFYIYLKAKVLNRKVLFRILETIFQNNPLHMNQIVNF